MHLARGSCSYMGSLFKLTLARGSDPYMPLFSNIHLARGSSSFLGSLFKVTLARGSDPYMMSLFSMCTSRVVVSHSRLAIRCLFTGSLVRGETWQNILETSIVTHIRSQ